MRDSDYDVVRIMRELELALIGNMKRNLKNHIKEEIEIDKQYTQWQAEKLKSLLQFNKENKELLNLYSPRISHALNTHLMTEWKQGVSAVEKAIAHKRVSQTWFKTNDRKIKALIKSIDKDFKKAEYAMLRRIDDQYRKTIFNAEMYTATGTKTIDQAVALANEQFYKRGIDCIVYKNGAVHTISDYTRMCIRTAEKRAYLTGEGSKRDEYKEYLCKVSTHLKSCSVCEPWEGKILIDDVYAKPTEEEIERLLDKGYDLLSDAMADGLFHPNCAHGLSMYIELD
jgi:hypothetical protein